MNKELKAEFDHVCEVLKTYERYVNAECVMNYDLETICPSKGMEYQGETISFFATKGYELIKDNGFVNDVTYLNAHIDEFEERDRVLIKTLFEENERNRNITPEMNSEFENIINKSYIDWLSAKQKSDYSIFAPSLSKVRDVELKKIKLYDKASPVVYDNLLDLYEKGVTSADLDEYFGRYKERMIPLFEKIKKSDKKIRTDFLSRKVTDEQQRLMAVYLMNLIGFDFDRGAFTTTEHPFTDGLARNDIRITTHYYPEMFSASMYTILHEGGHALFEMFVPVEDYDHHINFYKTMGQHESVSRFYENRIGRSKEFIHLIFPKVREIIPQVVSDVSEEEFYEGLNVVRPTFIRTEADEFTYTFHVIIRYEIEQMIVNRQVEIKDIPKLWNRKYTEYLGITPSNDREGVLQDMHWSSGFGYFPAYALGNMYNAMYYNTMDKEIGIMQCVSEGHIDKINDWMKERVFKRADMLDPKPWIKEITGRSLEPDDFMDYLDDKYSEMYGI